MIAVFLFAWKIRVVSRGVSKGDSLVPIELQAALHGFAWRSRFKDTPSLHASLYLDHGTEPIPRIRACQTYQVNNTMRTGRALNAIVESDSKLQYLPRQISQAVKIYKIAPDRRRQDGGCAVRSDGEKEEGSLRRADRGEVKTKRADWQNLLSAGQPATSESSVLQVGYCGPNLRTPRTPT